MHLKSLTTILIFATCSWSAISCSKLSDYKMIIDVDPGSDDAVSIFMALIMEEHFGGPEVVAITTTHGNADVLTTTNNAFRTLRIVDRQDIPVYLGTNYSIMYQPKLGGDYGNDALGDTNFDANLTEPLRSPQTTHASVALVEYSKKYEGKLIIAAMATLTNIALAIRLDPQFFSRVHKVVVMGGTSNGNGNVNPTKNADYNSNLDPEAYHIFLEAATPEQVLISTSNAVKEMNSSLAWRKNVLGKIQSKTVQFMNAIEEISFKDGITHWPGVYDPVAIAALYNPAIITSKKEIQLGVVICGEYRSSNILLQSNATTNNAVVIEGFDNILFQDFMMKIFKKSQ